MMQGPCPVLEIVATEGPRVTPGGAQHMVEPEEKHLWPHAYAHHVEMHEDHHQSAGVWH
jgi:hypothetical protein